MGKLYQIGSPPPQKPPGGNPLMWALTGGSVVMVFMAIIVALIVKQRPPGPVQNARAVTAPGANTTAAGEPAGAAFPAVQEPGYQYPPGQDPNNPYRYSRFNRQRQMRTRSFRSANPRNSWSASSVPQSAPGVPQNVAPNSALPPAQYLPQPGYSNRFAAPSVRTVQAPRVPSANGVYPGRNYPRFQQTAAYGGGSPQDVIARIKGSVLLILADGPQGLGSGTGFVVSGYQVATCAHVVEGARRVQLFSPDGRRYRATIANADRLNDVAVLTVSGSLPPPLALGSYNQARDGDEIAVTGYPQMFSMLSEGFAPTPSTSRGSISARRAQTVNGMVVPQIQTDAAINPGNSGGPLYSLRDGTVYGLAASLLSGSQGMNFAASVDSLRRLLGR